MKKDKTPKVMGRPKKPIDWEVFDKLCALQCTQVEMASWFDCSVDTLERRCTEEKGMIFAEYYIQKAGKGKISLRRHQWQLAEKGNATMLIWLGKQVLGQKDKADITSDGMALQLMSNIPRPELSNVAVAEDGLVKISTNGNGHSNGNGLH